MSLSDRIAGRKPVTTPPDVAATDAARNGAKAPVHGAPGTPGNPAMPGPPAATMYTAQRQGDEAPLSTLDQLKVDLHRRLISRLDLDALERIKSEAELTSQIRQAVLEFIREEATPLSQREREEIVEQVIDEVTGLGPIEPLFRDRTISDILVNGARQIYVERAGRLTRVAASFRNDAHLMPSSTASSAASAAGSTKLADGRRAAPRWFACQRDHPAAGARRAGADDPAVRARPSAADDLIRNGTLTEQMLDFLGPASRPA